MKAIIEIKPELTLDMHAMLESYANRFGPHKTVATSTTTVEITFDETTKNSDEILKIAAHVGNIFGCGPHIRFV